MAGITLAQAQAQLAAWLAASSAVAISQAYEIDTGNGSRKLTRADAAEIRQQVTFWDQQVKSLTAAASGGRRRVRYVVPE
ncbi:DUF6148 family protein [Bradyrhizobium sp. SZCCHNS3002]|uniref:DUF6148 family protein n=1 Tax=Bradyrhizobium sp. SZCCHNS3002 TaxID=3057310 RepID=UPI0028F0AE4C|nr:DUF6148 family protein [Bradyrhizobium sp. SZCCHNS3002]